MPITHIQITFKTIFIAPAFLFNFIINANALALEDMPGSADHPQFNRVTGTTIVAHYQSDYAEHEFLTETATNRKDLKTTFKEGKLTRIVYSLPAEQTALFVFRNYKETFNALGEVTEIYTCKRKQCPRDIGKGFIWNKDKRIPSHIKTVDKMYQITPYNSDPFYWYSEIQSDTAKYNVSFFSATLNVENGSIKKEGFQKGRTFAHLSIVESSDFKSDIAVVEASEIQQSISEKGHVALYGLFFDTGKDTLTTESKPALAEIAKAMKADNALKVYVVGHTDNVGSLESNQQLSERRAASIVNSLMQNFSIDQSRLVPIGVGLAAPVSTNDTEEGRALNRRVELVKR